MDIITAIKNRRSVRAYDQRTIPDNTCQLLLSALRYAPSACNLQPWHFIIVKDENLRRDLAQACNSQTWMAQAPLIIAACGDPEKAYKVMGGQHNSLDTDLAIALDHLSLAAVEQGLGTCWIGAFDEQKVKALLSVVPDIRVVTLMTVGYPASPDLNHPVKEQKRKPTSEIFSYDHY